MNSTEPQLLKESLVVKRGKEDLTIVVSKKVAPKAVDRNRMKRLIKEALRSFDNNYPNLKVIVRKNFANAKMAQVKDYLATLLK